MTSSTTAAPPAGAASDRLLLWPTMLSVASAALVVLLCGLPGTLSFVLILFSGLGFPAAAIALLGLVVVFLARRRPLKAASVLLALVIPALLWDPINWAAECIHLGITVGFGAGQIGDTPGTPGNEFAVYDWSVGLTGGPNTFVIHDITDEIALPLAQHKHPVSSENGFGEECSGRVRRLIGHYYVCNF